MSSSRQGAWSRLSVSPRVFRWIMNVWPPFLGLRIHIEHIAPDWRALRVRMTLSLTNRNYVGSHFGGGLFAMVDPYYMIMLMHLLGRDYLVWDKAARIEFLNPGRTIVHAVFRVTDDMLADVRARTADGQKYEPTYTVDIVDAAGETVARVEKTLYIRKKTPLKSPDAGT